MFAGSNFKASDILLQALRFVILLSPLAPVSIATLTAARLLQSWLLLNGDELMYSARRNVPFTAISARLNDDLGLVSASNTWILLSSGQLTILLHVNLNMSQWHVHFAFSSRIFKFGPFADQ